MLKILLKTIVCTTVVYFLTIQIVALCDSREVWLLAGLAFAILFSVFLCTFTILSRIKELAKQIMREDPLKMDEGASFDK